MHLLVIANSQVALTAKAIGPEAIKGLNFATMCKEEPESENRLSKDVKNCISNDLSINRPLAGSIADTPDNWVQSPEDESEASNAGEELRSSIILGRDCTTAGDREDVHDDQIGNAAHCIVSPFLAVGFTKGSKETGENHNHICDNSDKEIGAIHTREEAEIEEKERSSDTPVNLACC